MKKKGIALGIVIAFLFLIAIIYLIFTQLIQKKSPNVIKKEVVTVKPIIACTDDEINKANTGINENDVATLRALSEQIQQKANYSSDINCEYIMARFYLAVGSGKAAIESADQLMRLDTAGAKYSEKFYPRPLDPIKIKRLGESIQKMEKSQNNINTDEDLNAIDKEKNVQ